MMKLRKISDYLDSMFQVAVYGDLDTSFSARMHYFPRDVILNISPLFLSRYNGLMMENSDNITEVVTSCFLSDDIVDELRTRRISNALLICHHMLDIDAGQPGTWNARGFSAISSESFAYLQKHGISVYILHLPLDANESKINTHLSFCNRLGLFPQTELLHRHGFTMGYLVNGSPLWHVTAERIFSSKIVYGKFVNDVEHFDAPIAVLAGMVSSTSMLEEIVTTGCSCLVCGDVLLRQRTKRAEDISKWLKYTPLPIVCFSHKETEEPALKDLLTHINRIFPTIPTRFLRGGLQWK